MNKKRSPIEFCFHAGLDEAQEKQLTKELEAMIANELSPLAHLVLENNKKDTKEDS